jgi:TPR repeat protein
MIKPQEPFFKPPEETPAVQTAAQSGDAEAQFRLAGRYFTGSGIEKSLTEALRWYETASSNGNAEAAYNLGTIYDYGLGTTSDRTRATRWYRRASEREHTAAQERLRVLAATSER